MTNPDALRQLAPTGKLRGGIVVSPAASAFFAIRDGKGDVRGVTVDLLSSRLLIGDRMVQVVDLPGIYDLGGHSEDERVVMTFLRNNRVDLAVVLVNAAHLERQSALLLQQAQTQAQREKEDIIEGAKVEAKRLLEQAHLGADFELRHQLQAVQRDVVERSVERARGILQKTMDQKDNVRLVDAFLRDLSEENLEVR